MCSVASTSVNSTSTPSARCALTASPGGAPASDLFGVIPWPNLPLADESLSETLGSAHTLSVKAIYVVLALHVLGALKHHFFDKDVVLARMVPFLPKRS